MQDNALCRARELSPSVRAAFESVLGRSLQDEETVSVNANPNRLAPQGTAREAAYERLMGFADRLAERVKGVVPDEEVEAAIEEAVDYVRHHPQ